ncbi:hypothetical protein BV22DRAFT_1050805 [Leucogyrophana mollusca]|uniref:Uncharacterized protein n=1 Tax=Leucogyrophana mollusca TaxID=85980 RepID=A0ACB8B2B9_9AGAM|nr:hypothetical protein BV22DRAFT_1050805 [Leucogyrophana mollusca]
MPQPTLMTSFPVGYGIATTARPTPTHSVDTNTAPRSPSGHMRHAATRFMPISWVHDIGGHGTCTGHGSSATQPEHSYSERNPARRGDVCAIIYITNLPLIRYDDPKNESIHTVQRRRAHSQHLRTFAEPNEAGT